MSTKLYMDVHVRRAVTIGLRLRGVDVLTAQEDGSERFDDPPLLARATELDRVLFTQDDDLLKEAGRRQDTGKGFAGVIYGHQLNVTIGQCIQDLELIAEATEPEEWANLVTYLPLK
jgi:predicted nuclease of predicted toxin-antitoxin system